ncbi:hypothetical protein Pan258_24770 [Symmachiella dynata]|nr:hypothetical protein Pan258_24770 [Symmachiella dynata]
MRLNLQGRWIPFWKQCTVKPSIQWKLMTPYAPQGESDETIAIP